MVGNDARQRDHEGIIKTVLRMLRKACDFYIRGMEYCDGQVSLSTYVPSTIPRSFSVHKATNAVGCDEKDYRELIRAASTEGRLVTADGNKEIRILQQPSRSCSVRPVGISRIDEDREAELGEENLKMYPRSRSYAVRRKVGGLL